MNPFFAYTCAIVLAGSAVISVAADMTAPTTNGTVKQMHAKPQHKVIMSKSYIMDKPGAPKTIEQKAQASKKHTHKTKHHKAKHKV